MQINISPNFKISNFTFEAKNIIFDELKKHFNSVNTSLIPSYKMVDLINYLYSQNADKGIEVNIDDFLFNNQIELIDKIKLAIKEIYIDATNEIEKSKFSKNILTPNDLIKYAVKLMQDKQTAKLIAQQFSYLFVDEFQDTSSTQFNLITSMMDNGVNVFVAGDTNQSIYEFRGANKDNFKNMITQINSKNVGQTLSENFRADNNLLQNINYIFKSTFTFNNKKINFEHIDFQNISLGIIENSMNILYSSRIDDTVNKSLLGSSSYNGISILCRNNYELRECSIVLKNANIPTIVYGGKSFYKSPYIIDVCKILTSLIYSCELNDHEMQYTEFYMSFCKANNDNTFNQLMDELRHTIKRQSVSNFLNQLYEKSFIIKYLQKLNNQQEIANLYKLIDMSRNYKQASYQAIEFVEFLNIMISTGKEEEQAEIPFNKIKNAVTLSTIHRAKGLSFETVIIPYIDRNLYRPNSRPKVIFEKGSSLGIDCKSLFSKQEQNLIDTDFEQSFSDKIIKNLEEELRIFYVAMTRAKKHVFFACEKPYEKLKYKMSLPNYTSYFKWLYEIDNGKFLNKIKFTP